MCNIDLIGLNQYSFFIIIYTKKKIEIFLLCFFCAKYEKSLMLKFLKLNPLILII